MSKLMWIAGILLVATGAALALMGLVSAASVAGFGISLEMAVILLVGGILSMGLGSVISLLDQQRALLAERVGLPASVPSAAIPEFGRKAGEAAVAGAAATAAGALGAREGDELSEPTRDTIKALEQARQKIEQAFEPKPDKTALADEDLPEPRGSRATAEAEPEAEDVLEDEAAPAQLYVVEERFIRLRPARILSDGTVEAETGEGWMRFENLEHLDEYLDAMESAKS
ncbi:MAG: hypothetical protein IOC86_02825 [Aestuariivirga sp.]|nr:hypothetical protein [Aestuariivirga sp.]